MGCSIERPRNDLLQSSDENRRRGSQGEYLGGVFVAARPRSSLKHLADPSCSRHKRSSKKNCDSRKVAVLLRFLVCAVLVLLVACSVCRWFWCYFRCGVKSLSLIFDACLCSVKEQPGLTKRSEIIDVVVDG